MSSGWRFWACSVGDAISNRQAANNVTANVPANLLLMFLVISFARLAAKVDIPAALGGMRYLLGVAREQPPNAANHLKGAEGAKRQEDAINAERDPGAGSGIPRVGINEIPDEDRGKARGDKNPSS